MRGRSREIMRRYLNGEAQADIARALNCSPANVCKCIKRYRAWGGDLSPLPMQHHNWIVDVAERKKVRPETLASALLMMVIDQVKTENLSQYLQNYYGSFTAGES